jgi:hypothetical protein
MAPAEEKKIALRKKKDILPQGEKFPCARKFISFRKEISPSSEGGLSPYTISN